MSEFDSEYYPEGNYDGSEDVLWGENRWAKYLQKGKQEVAVFIELYKQLRLGEISWLEISQKMGWTVNVPDGQMQTLLDGNAMFIEVGAQMFIEDDLEEEEFDEDDDEFCVGDPWTVHRHPAFVLTEGLIFYIKEQYEAFLKMSPQVASTVLSWELMKQLGGVSKNAILSLHALELAEYSLTIAHLKYSMAHLNRILGLLGQIKTKRSECIDNIYVAIFDLRETYTKVVSDCRSFTSQDLDY